MAQPKSNCESSMQCEPMTCNPALRRSVSAAAQLPNYSLRFNAHHSVYTVALPTQHTRCNSRAIVPATVIPQNRSYCLRPINPTHQLNTQCAWQQHAACTPVPMSPTDNPLIQLCTYALHHYAGTLHAFQCSGSRTDLLQRKLPPKSVRPKPAHPLHRPYILQTIRSGSYAEHNLAAPLLHETASLPSLL